MENGGAGTKDSYTIGEVVARLRPEFPTLSVSKIRYLERRRLINLTRTRGGYRLFSGQDIELLKYILTLQDKEYLPLKVIKKRIEGGGGISTGGDSANDLSRVLEDRTYTREELADTLETESRFVDELAADVLDSRGVARSDLVEEHRQIATLIRKGESEKALDVLKQHFDDAVVTIKSRETDAKKDAE
jgi:DNA-binding transcriptional MerR regulator